MNKFSASDQFQNRIKHINYSTTCEKSITSRNYLDSFRYNLMLIQNNNRQNIANAALISSHVTLKSANSFILPQKSEIEIRTNENTFGQQKSANKSNVKSANKNSKSVGGKKATSKAKQGCKENQVYSTLKEK